MEEFLEYVLRQLVEFPDEIVIARHEAGRKITFNIRLRQSDVGKVIGRHGSTIKALRGLIDASASRTGQRGTVQIIEQRAASAPGR